MKDKEIDKASREDPDTSIKQVGSFCAFPKMDWIDTNMVEDMSRKIGNLWLVISFI
jgi:hypothetical protein